MNILWAFRSNGVWCQNKQVVSCYGLAANVGSIAMGSCDAGATFADHVLGEYCCRDH